MMQGCPAVQLRVRVTIKMRNDCGDICVGGPHISHYWSFTLKGLNRGCFRRPCGGVISHANVLYRVPLLQGTEVMVRMLPLFFYCFQASFFFHLIPLYFQNVDSCSNLTLPSKPFFQLSKNQDELKAELDRFIALADP